MVGVGGGVPTNRVGYDIRLGDVVVSTPSDGDGGIFQYDFGKTIQNQGFQTTGFHDQPPTILRTACQAIRARYDTGNHLRDAIDAAFKGGGLTDRYKRPDSKTDRLYKPEVVHKEGGQSCAVACGDHSSTNELKNAP